MTAEEFYEQFKGWEDDPLTTDGIMVTKADVFRCMEAYANERVKKSTGNQESLIANLSHNNHTKAERIKQLEEGLRGVVITDGEVAEWHNINVKQLEVIKNLLNKTD